MKTTWSGLTYAYTAPESVTLLSVVDPVATDTDTFADDLEAERTCANAIRAIAPWHASTGEDEDDAGQAAIDQLKSEHPEIFSAPPSEYPVDSVGGLVSRTADVNHLTTNQMYRSLGLDYVGPFRAADGGPHPHQTMFGIEFEAGNASPTKADHTINTITAHFDELQGLSGPDYVTRVQELVEQDFRADHPGDLSKAAADELTDRLDYSGRALDPANPHRENGFGGSPATGHYTPELQLFDRPPLRSGAELWIAPDGSRVVVARFDGYGWDVQR